MSDDKTRKYHVIPGVIDTRPNILEIFFNPKFVQGTDIDVIAAITNTVARRYRATLHPDTHRGRNSIARQSKIEELNASLERASEIGYTALAEEMKDNAKQKAIKRPKSEISSQTPEIRRQRESLLSEAILQGLHNPEAISHARFFEIVFSQRFNVLSSGDKNKLALLSGGNTQKKITYTLLDKQEEVPQELVADRPDIGSPHLKNAAFIKSGIRFDLHDSAPFASTANGKEATATPDGLTITRGTKTELNDNRSAEHYEPTYPSREISNVHLIGCISPSVWEYMTKTMLQPAITSHTRRFAEIEAGGTVDKSSEDIRFSGITYEQHHLGFNAEQLDQALRYSGRSDPDSEGFGFSTELHKDWILIGHHEMVTRADALSPTRPTQFVPFGNIEYAIADNF